MAISEPITIDGCATLSALFRKRVREHADRVVMREKDLGIWNEYTWRDYGDQARWIGLGLKALGLERGDVCSVASEINKEWVFADMGILCAGGVVNGVYPTDAPNQVEYLVNDSGTRFYFAETRSSWTRFWRCASARRLSPGSLSSTWRACATWTIPSA